MRSISGLRKMNPTESDLRDAAMRLEARFDQEYWAVSGGTYDGDLLMTEVFYRLLAAGIIEVGPGLDG